MSFSDKVQKAKNLVSEGKYGYLFSSVFKKFLSVFLGKNNASKMAWSVRYLYLKKRYQPFISEYVSQKLSINTQMGGGKTTETPNIIWWFWFQGEDNAPDICKSCLRSLRRWYSDKKIITLSSQNLHEYVKLPDYINEKHEKEIISHTHYSDLVRLQLLIEHGGTWIDSTVLCTSRKFEYVMHFPLFFFHYSNWFMVSAPDNQLLTLVRDLHFMYWKDFNYCMDYYIFPMFFDMAANVYKDDWYNMPFISSRPLLEMSHAMYEEYSEEKMNHFKEISGFHKLTYKIDPKNPPSSSSIYQYVINNF